MKCNVPNANGDVFPIDVMQKAIEKYQEKIDADKAYGELQISPYAKPSINLAQISHKVTKMELDKDGSYNVEALVLDTPQGKILSQILESGIKPRTNMCSCGVVKDGVVKSMKITSINFLPPQ
jgi:hypothetical protein